MYWDFFFFKCWFGDAICREQPHPPCGCLLIRCPPHSSAGLLQFLQPCSSCQLLPVGAMHLLCLAPCEDLEVPYAPGHAFPTERGVVTHYQKPTGCSMERNIKGVKKGRDRAGGLCGQNRAWGVMVWAGVFQVSPGCCGSQGHSFRVPPHSGMSTSE